MTSSDLAAWRKWMGFSQRDAAAALGVSLPTHQRLERGAKWADSEPIEIDRRTTLACAAIASGVDEFAPWRVGVSSSPLNGPQRAAGSEHNDQTADSKTADSKTADSKTAGSGERVGGDAWSEGDWE